jgi:putative flavoprotein involved in K+ transport
MPRVSTLVIGAGQAGLAMSHCLSAFGVDHVVFERGQIAERWRIQSWDSLRLLTPNWMTRLPGFHYQGDDPDGFMAIPELVTFFERYAAASRAPVLTDTTVERVERSNHQFRVTTNRGDWSADAVVIATGFCGDSLVPQISRHLAPSVTQIVPSAYRRPDQLPDGGVLIVGASSTGIQLADEIQRSGRQVMLAIGRHTRLPRRYRGHDILWWLDRLGSLSERADQVASIEISRHQPSLQLVGRLDHSSLDLGVLHDAGVRLVGRVLQIDGHQVRFADDLVAATAAADVKMVEVQSRIDKHILTMGISADQPEPFRPTWTIADDAPTTLNLEADGIRTVIWATGCRRAYPWLRLPVLDHHGDIVHQGGVTTTAGLYVLGMQFQRRRNSAFIDGVGADAWVIAQAIADIAAGVQVA